MTIRARVLPRWPVVVQGTGGVTVDYDHGRATIGFDYEDSEFGIELEQAIAAAAASATAAETAETNAETAETNAEAAAAAAAASAEEAASIVDSGVFVSPTPKTTTNQATLRGTINLGHYLEDEPDTPGEINAAFTRLFADVAGGQFGVNVEIPPQTTFYFNDTITIPATKQFTFHCPGGLSTRFFCTIAMTSLPMFANSSDTIAQFQWHGGTFVGGGFATHAFAFEEFQHGVFADFRVEGTTGYAVRTNNGYSNILRHLDLSENTGGGLDMSGEANNANTLIHVKCNENDGIGFQLANGLGFSLVGCAAEKNKQAGLVAYDVRGLRIAGGYFERNAEDGLTLPVTGGGDQLVKADIHLLNGGRVIDYTDPAAAVYGFIMDGVSFTPYGTLDTPTSGLEQDCVVFAVGLNNARITNCDLLDQDKSGPMVGVYGDGQLTTIDSATVEGNTRNDIGFIGTPNSEFTVATAHNFSSRSQRNAHNYASLNFLGDWTAATGTTGSLSKAQQRGFAGHDAWIIGPGDRLWTHSIDTTLYPELLGKYVVFCVPYRIQESDTALQLICSGVTNHDGTLTNFETASGQWNFASVLALIDPGASGIVIGMKQFESVTDGPVVSMPFLVEVGVNIADAVRVTPSVVYKSVAAAAPTTGYWEVGTRVLNSVPTVGQPKARACTVSGTPGTWVSEGDL